MTAVLYFSLIIIGQSVSHALNHTDYSGSHISCDVLDSNKDELCGYLVKNKGNLKVSLIPIYSAMKQNNMNYHDLMSFTEEDLRVIISEFAVKLPQLHTARLINILRNDKNTYIYREYKNKIYPLNDDTSPVVPNKLSNELESLITEKNMDIKRLTLQHLKAKEKTRQKYEKMMQKELAGIAARVDQFKQEIQRQIDILTDYQDQIKSGYSSQHNFKYLDFIRNWNISMNISNLNKTHSWPKTPKIVISPLFNRILLSATFAHLEINARELLKSSKCLIYISSNTSTFTQDGMVWLNGDDTAPYIPNQDIYGLEPSTEYTVWMVVINKYGHSLPSNEITFTTKSTEIYDEKACGVVQLNGSTFDNFISQHDIVMVYFYAPWIGQSQPLRPRYEMAAKLIDARYSRKDVALAEIDGTMEIELSEKYGIDEYPTLMLFRNERIFQIEGGIGIVLNPPIYEKYTGGRDVIDIVHYVMTEWWEFKKREFM